jgi:FkbM family methyltransferase
VKSRIFRLVRQAVYKLSRLPVLNGLMRRLLPLGVSQRALASGKYVFPVRGTFPVRFPAGRDFMMCSDGSDTIASRVYFGGALSFEPSTSSILTKYFNEGGTFFDIGANSGLYTLMGAAMPKVKEVHAFEPVGVVFNVLSRNVSKNKFAHVHAIQQALSDKQGELEINVPVGITLPTGSSAAGSLKTKEEARSEKVPVSTLDRYVEAAGVTGCDLIKIDTETTEAEVIRGGLTTIGRFRPVIVCEVINKKVGQDIQALLSPLNYCFFHLTSQGPVKTASIHPDPSLHDMNFLFLPVEREANR